MSERETVCVEQVMNSRFIVIDGLEIKAPEDDPDKQKHLDAMRNAWTVPGLFDVLARELDGVPDIPLVADPVMVAKGGARLLDDGAHGAMQSLILPRAAVTGAARSVRVAAVRHSIVRASTVRTSTPRTSPVPPRTSGGRTVGGVRRLERILGSGGGRVDAVHDADQHIADWRESHAPVGSGLGNFEDPLLGLVE